MKCRYRPVGSGKSELNAHVDVGKICVICKTSPQEPFTFPPESVLLCPVPFIVFPIMHHFALADGS